MIRDNGGHHGSLPPFWANRGARYMKQAHCTDPDAVRDIYERVAAGESLSSIGRTHVNPRSGKTLYPASITKLVRFAANHTGIIECRYTYAGSPRHGRMRPLPWLSRLCGGGLTVSLTLT